MTRRGGGDDSTNSINSTGAGAFFRLPEKTSILSLLSSCLSYFKAEQNVKGPFDPCKHGIKQAWGTRPFSYQASLPV
jgi:hypothetical protein